MTSSLLHEAPSLIFFWRTPWLIAQINANNILVEKGIANLWKGITLHTVFEKVDVQRHGYDIHQEKSHMQSTFIALSSCARVTPIPQWVTFQNWDHFQLNLSV